MLVALLLLQAPPPLLLLPLLLLRNLLLLLPHSQAAARAGVTCSSKRFGSVLGAAAATAWLDVLLPIAWLRLHLLLLLRPLLSLSSSNNLLLQPGLWWSASLASVIRGHTQAMAARLIGGGS